MRNFISFMIFSCIFSACGQVNQKAIDKPIQKPRVIVITDGEADDQDSFIRFLLYSNEMNIVGLVYSSSMWHYKGDGKGTLFTSKMDMTSKMYGQRTDLRWIGTNWMSELIDKYGEVHSNLLKHDPTYPSPDYLKSKIHVGNINFEGDMSEDTDGSDFIKQLLLDENDQPIYVQMWGGTNTLARALKSIEDQYKTTADWSTVYNKVSAKTNLYIILDQDATYKEYVAINWPDIKTIYNAGQFWCLGYEGVKVVPDTIRKFLSGDWFTKHIVNGHGQLLSTYYLWGDGRKLEGDPDYNQWSEEAMTKSGFNKFDFLSEGDSPSFFHLLDFGLNPTFNPGYGGLGGRFVQSEDLSSRWEDNQASAEYNPYTQKMDAQYSQIRWIEVLQNDFAARANWCISDFKNANHSPNVSVTENSLNAKAGDMVHINATIDDPDNNKINLNFWEYKEAGSGHGIVTINQKNNTQAEVSLSSSFKKGDTVHIIVQGNDDGTPTLTNFQRVVITII